MSVSHERGEGQGDAAFVDRFRHIYKSFLPSVISTNICCRLCFFQKLPNTGSIDVQVSWSGFDIGSKPFLNVNSKIIRSF